MKKYICFIIFCVLLVTSSFGVCAEYNNNPLEIDESLMEDFKNGDIKVSISNLCRFDIVREPYSKWEKGDAISRRNAFEMAYIVYARGNRDLNADIIDSLLSDATIDPIIFSDAERGTYDYYLLFSLYMNSGLINGKVTSDGTRIADLDSYITYGETLVLISRLLDRHWRTSYKISDLLSSDGYNLINYIEFFENIGLINSNTYVNFSSLTVTEDILQKPISAYEFMHLLHNVLYTPISFAGSYGGTAYGFRYIDYFVQPLDKVTESKDNEKNKTSIAIP